MARNSPSAPARWSYPFPLLVAATAGSALGLGAVHLPVLFAVSVLALVAALSGAGSRLGVFPGAAKVLLGFAVASWLQAIPLPAAALQALSPTGLEVWNRMLAVAGPSPRAWLPISQDPGASVVEGLKWLTYAVLFALAASLGRKKGAAWAVALIFSTGVVVAGVTLVHGLADATSVYGVYAPSFAAGRWHVGPLLNSNNLAGFLNLAAICGVGLMHVESKRAAVRPAVGLGLALVVGATLASASRAGALLLPLGVLAVGVVLARRRPRPARHRPSGAWVVVVPVVGGAVLALLSATTETWRDLYDANLSKYQVMRAAVPMLRDHVWAGVGRGAFDSAFAAYSPSGTNIRYAHAENFPLQWACEWGLPIAALGSITLLWQLRPVRLLSSRSPTSLAAVVGLATLALHNLVDLAFEVPAVMIAAWVLLGAVWGAEQRSQREDREAPPVWRQRATRWVPALLTGVAICAAASLGWNDVRSDRAKIGSLFRKAAQCQTQDCAESFIGAVKDAMRRHPAEPYFPLLAALFLAERDGPALPWLRLTLQNSPSNARAHAVLGDFLARKAHAAQGFMHFRLAVESDPSVAEWCAKRAVARTKDYEQLVRTVPAGQFGPLMLDVLVNALDTSTDRPLRRRLLMEAVARDPNRVSSRGALAREVLADIRSGSQSEECGGSRREVCAADVRAHADAMARADSGSSEGVRVRAELLRALGDPGAAENALRAKCPVVRDQAACLEARLAAALEQSDDAVQRAAIRDFIALRCTDSEHCAGAAELVADLLVARGSWLLAGSYYDRAIEDGPTEARWLKAAAARSKAGAHAKAVHALEQAARLRGGADAELRAKIEQERNAARDGVLK